MPLTLPVRHPLQRRSRAYATLGLPLRAAARDDRPASEEESDDAATFATILRAPELKRWIDHHDQAPEDGAGAVLSSTIASRNSPTKRVEFIPESLAGKTEADLTSRPRPP